MEDVTRLLTYKGQKDYYMRILGVHLKGKLFSYLIDEIISYALDIGAVAIKCFATIVEESYTSHFCVSKNGKKIVMAVESDLSIWNTETMKRIGILKAHEGYITCCCI